MLVRRQLIEWSRLQSRENNSVQRLSRLVGAGGFNLAWMTKKICEYLQLKQGPSSGGEI